MTMQRDKRFLFTLSRCILGYQFSRPRPPLSIAIASTLIRIRLPLHVQTPFFKLPAHAHSSPTRQPVIHSLSADHSPTDPTETHQSHQPFSFPFFSPFPSDPWWMSPMEGCVVTPISPSARLPHHLTEGVRDHSPVDGAYDLLPIISHSHSSPCTRFQPTLIFFILLRPPVPVPASGLVEDFSFEPTTLGSLEVYPGGACSPSPPLPPRNQGRLTTGRLEVLTLGAAEVKVDLGRPRACAWFCNSARVGIWGRVGGEGAKRGSENEARRVVRLDMVSRGQGGVSRARSVGSGRIIKLLAEIA